MIKSFFLQKKLSVLFLCGWYPSRVLPTNGDFIERHAKAVSKLHDVTVIHIITDPLLTKKEEIIINKEQNVTTYIAYIEAKSNGLSKAISFFKIFKKIYAKIDTVDIIHLNEVYPFGIFSLYLKWILKKPYIISEHWTGYHKPQSEEISWLQQKISNIITKNASFVCPVSDDLEKAMKSIPLQGNYKKVPNVVDTNLFYPIEKKEKEFNIVHISNMIDAHKNVKGILEVIAKLQSKNIDFTFKLIGDNSIQYQNFANEVGINTNKITFIDQIPHNEVAKHLQNTDLFLLFSNYENLPCVILEAFSCGVPVISTNVGGISEYFPNDFGVLISKNNQEVLLQEILNLYHKKHTNDNKNSMYEYVKSNFSEITIAELFTDLYVKALKK